MTPAKPSRREAKMAATVKAGTDHYEEMPDDYRRPPATVRWALDDDHESFMAGINNSGGRYSYDKQHRGSYDHEVVRPLK